jgi:acetoin utilization deacetylase AcuC-like enzyme
MQVVYHEAQRRHDPRHFLVNGAPQPSPEVPGRIDALLAAAKEGGHQVVAPRDHGLAPLAAVHSPEYLSFLETIYTRWQRIEGASAEVVPNIHPDGPGAGYPRSAVGQAGYHMADTACPMTADTWGSTLASAWSAVEGAELILAGARAAYALCRPPGHHAFKDRAGGFCYVNNCAVAATVLRREAARVAIFDVDLHHGNGTQGIFYRRDDVLTVSTHADPIRFYPFFWGYAGERGEGPGLGYNLNLPLARGSDDAVYAPALEAALAHIRSFAPDALVVALGLDAHESDPFEGLRISTDGFGRIAEAVAGLGLPTLLVQEGGYLSEHLGPNLARFLESFEAAHGARA